jgi:hypothetical protein
MANKLNESFYFENKLYKILIRESHQIFNEIIELENEVPRDLLSKVSLIQKSFKSLVKSWRHLHRTTKIQIDDCQKSVLHFKKHKEKRKSVNRKIILQRKSLQSAEKKITKKQRAAGKSLTKFTKAWKIELKDMKKMLKTQKSKESQIKENFDDFDLKLSCQSVLDNSGFFEENGPTIIIQDVSRISNVSAEFEMELKKLEQKISHDFQFFSEEQDVSRSGWKSEFDSQNESLALSPSQIKSAINILKKANLLNPSNQELLSHLTNIDNSQKLELALQLVNLKKILPTDSPIQIIRDSSSSSKEEQKVSLFSKFDSNKPNQNHEKFESHFKNNEKSDFHDSSSRGFFENGFSEAPEKQHELNLEQETLIENLYQNESKAPAKKGTFDYQSTGISSHSGFRSRITLKTVGSENSQKVLMTGTKTIEETFHDM